MIDEWDVRKRLANAILNYKIKNKFSEPNSFKEIIPSIEPSLKIKYTDLIHNDGQYIDQDKTILINKSIDYLPRQNFTFYHEFTHYLIYQVDEFQDIFEFLNENIGDKRNITKVIEDLCNFGASEFLVEEYTKEIILNSQIEDLEVFKSLISNNSTLSVPALAYKLADTRKIPMVVVIIHDGINTRKRTSTRRYPYIEYSFNTASFKYPCWGNLPQNHLLKRGVEEDIDLVLEKSTFPFSSSTNMPCYINGYKHTTSRYLACLYKNKPILKSPEQLELI